MDTYDVVTMLEAVESTPRPITYMRDTCFGGRFTTFPTEQVLVDNRKGRRVLAPFVSPIIGGKVMERKGFTTQFYTPSLIIPRDVITPQRLQARRPGENVISGRAPADRLTEEQADVLNSFDWAITRREEWMVCKFIFTGQIHMKGDGVDEVYSVGFDNIEELTDKFWADADGDPLGDLQGWVSQVVQKSGIAPDVCVMSRGVAQAFLKNADVQKMLDIRNITVGIINPTQLPSGVTYLGRLYDPALEIYVYEEWYVDEDTDLLAPMVPDGMLALIPSASRNPGAKMLYGAFTEMEEGVTYEGTRIPRTWTEKGPNTRIIEVVSRPLPVMVDSDCWLVATVLE